MLLPLLLVTRDEALCLVSEQVCAGGPLNLRCPLDLGAGLWEGS